MEAQGDGEKMISTALDGKQDIDIGIGVLGMEEGVLRLVWVWIGDGKMERCIGVGVEPSLGVMVHWNHGRAELRAALGRSDECGYECMTYERMESVGYTSGPRIRESIT